MRTERDPVQAVQRVLDDYAARGVLRALACRQPAGPCCSWQFRWFREREFRLALDPRAWRLRLDGVLGNVAPRSALDRDLRTWLRSRQADSLPAHRRADAGRMALTLRNSAGDIALLVRSHDHDLEYATRRMIQLLNELHLDFLPRGAPFDWLVETFGLDPDNPAWP